jgi:hypothetical protein
VVSFILKSVKLLFFGPTICNVIFIFDIKLGTIIIFAHIVIFHIVFLSVFERIIHTQQLYVASQSVIIFLYLLNKN